MPDNTIQSKSAETKVAEEFSDLFNTVNAVENLERPETNKANVPFSKKIEMVQGMMEKEPEIESGGDAPVQSFVEVDNILQEKTSGLKQSPEIERVVDENFASCSQNNTENPLGLDSSDFQAYEQIKKKYKRFRLFDGSMAYKHFYQWKVRILKEVLTRYKVLNISDMRQEIRETNTDHCVNEKIAAPDLIREKLDVCYKCRVRVATLLSEAYEQFPSWRRILDMLKGKLFKDHESGNRTGAHKRDGLAMEHLYDIEIYVKELEGFIDAAKMIDNLLMAAAESLSRQLSCIQIRESGGLGGKPNSKTSFSGVSHVEVPHVIEHNKPNELDGLDSVNDGEVIDNSNEEASFEVQNWSVVDKDDVLSGIG